MQTLPYDKLSTIDYRTILKLFTLLQGTWACRANQENKKSCQIKNMYLCIKVILVCLEKTIDAGAEVFISQIICNIGICCWNVD